jgi:hypothetical protein
MRAHIPILVREEKEGMVKGESGTDRAAWRRGGVLDSSGCRNESTHPCSCREEKEGMMIRRA